MADPVIVGRRGGGWGKSPPIYEKIYIKYKKVGYN